jgi:hypothetical protein
MYGPTRIFWANLTPFSLCRARCVLRAHALRSNRPAPSRGLPCACSMARQMHDRDHGAFLRLPSLTPAPRRAQWRRTPGSRARASARRTRWRAGLMISSRSLLLSLSPSLALSFSRSLLLSLSPSLALSFSRALLLSAPRSDRCRRYCHCRRYQDVYQDESYKFYLHGKGRVVTGEATATLT